MDPDKQEYTIAEAAKRKNVQRSTVFRAIKSGKLAAHAVPQSEVRSVWMVRHEDLDAWEPTVSLSERGRRGAAARYGKGEGE